MSDDARRIGEELRRAGFGEAAEVSDLVGKVDTRPHPEPGSPEAPPGIGDVGDATTAANQARAAEETRQHFAGLTPEQAGEQFFQDLLQGGNQ